jgi:dynein heavy chain
LDDSYNYGSEFYGIEHFAVITPLTERCFLSIWQAARIFKGSLLTGKSNVGKTQIAKVLYLLLNHNSNVNNFFLKKGLAQYLGKFILILYCSSHTDTISIANFLQGIAQVLRLLSFIFTNENL